jgi:predicted permease
MDAFLLDLRQSIRSLRASTGFALTVVLAMALGVGVTTTMFSAVDQLLIRSLPYPRPDRLMWLSQGSPTEPTGRMMLSQSRIDELREAREASVFESVSIFAGAEMVLTGAGEATRLSGTRVDSSFFRTMGVRPALGRGFAAEEDRPGAARVVMLSDELWRGRFASNPGVLGKSIRLDTTSYTVVGVMPPGFKFPNKTQFWSPLVAATNPRFRQCRQCAWGVGRLRDGVTIDGARARLRDLANANRAADASLPPAWRNNSVTLVTIRDWATNDARLKLLVLLGAVACVLLIACANVTNLLLARTTARRAQYAVRSAIGASRARIVRLVLVESSVLALPAAALGILLSLWGVTLLNAFIPRWSTIDSIHVDGRVLAFAVIVSVGSALLAAAWPAFQASAVSPGLAMRDDDHASGSIRRNRVRSGVVITQVAMTVVLLIASSLLAKSLGKLLSVDLGFTPDRLVTMTVQLTSAEHPDAASRDAFRTALEARLASLPGVRASAVSGGVPFGGLEMLTTVAVAADTSRRVFGPTLHTSGANCDVLGTRLVTGRRFSTNDSGVIIVSQSAADKLFRGASPLGQRVVVLGNQTMSIVGVVADMHYMERKGSPEPQIYLPINRSGLSYLVATLRTDGDPRALERTLRDVVRSIDPQQPVTSIATMDALLADSVKEPRTQTLMLGALGVLAFIMTCIGVYGVVSYSVTQRTREIGIRIALGADVQSVLGLVVGQGTILAGVGTAIGVVTSLWATRLVRTSLYEVSALDPWVFAATAAGILLVTAIASYLPARRATAIDPVAALRTE